MAGRGGGVAVLRCGTDGRVGGRTNRSRTVSFDAREPASGHAGVAPRNRTVAPKEPSMSTHQITEGSVVVGVDGSPSSEFALRWAVNDARRTRRPLHLVHALENEVVLSDKHQLGTKEAPVSYTHLRAHETRHDL